MNTPTYPDQLLAIGIRLLHPFTTAKAHQEMQCVYCTHNWVATPIAKLQVYKKTGMKGCPQCTKHATYNSKRLAATQRITDKGFEILSDYDGTQSTTYKISVRNKTCGHTFEVAPGNLLHRDVKCPVCNIEAKRARCHANSQAIVEEFRKTAPEWKVYKQTVYTLTGHTYRAYRDVINPDDLPQGLAGTEGAYQVDHIVPVRWCFDNNIPTEVCAHHTNLQMLGWRENIVARDNIKGEFPAVFVEHFAIAGVK